MRVTALEVTPLRIPLHTPFVTALRRTEEIATVVVRLTDEDGVSGWGEAPAVWQVTGESAASASACLDGPLRQVVIGAPTGELADDLPDVCRRVRAATVGNHGAKAALDIALHDLTARRAGVPLAELLAGRRVDLRLATDVTVAAGDADAVAATGADRVRDGFTCLKLKIGTDATTDVARVRALREAVGPDVAIRLDANQGWRADDAVRVIRALEDAGTAVELVEQPVPADDLDALAHVTASVDTPILADESVFGLRDLVEVIRRRAAGLVNVKLAKCGGLATAVELLRVAESHGVGTMVGSMMESHLGVGAAASLVAAHPTTVRSDLDAAWWARSSPYAGGMGYAGATLVLADEPGLGVRGLR